MKIRYRNKVFIFTKETQRESDVKILVLQYLIKKGISTSAVSHSYTMPCGQKCRGQIVPIYQFQVSENFIGAPKLKLLQCYLIVYYIFKYYESNIELFFIAPYKVIALDYLCVDFVFVFFLFAVSKVVALKYFSLSPLGL